VVFFECGRTLQGLGQTRIGVFSRAVSAIPTSLRVILMTSFFCTILGTCGLGSSTRSLGTAAIPNVTVHAAGSENANITEAREDLANAIFASQATIPGRRFLEVANLIASGLLIFAGFSMLRRRPEAIWWLTQAAIANSLHAVARGASSAAHWWKSAPELAPYFNRLMAAENPEVVNTASQDALPRGESFMHTVATMTVIAAALEVAMYVVITRRARRPEVRALLEAPPPKPYDPDDPS
jgi:hypothetical protein